MRFSTRFTTLAVLVASCVSAGQAGALLAEKKTAEVQVWAIRATTRNAEISPELRPIADKLKSQFKYTGFKLEKREKGTTETGRALSVALVGGYSAAVTPKSVDEQRVQLQIQVRKSGEDKPRLDATLTINAGEFQLSGGWDLGEGDALIVAVAAR